MAQPRQPRLLYLIGAPGVGKTTALAAAVAPWGPGTTVTEPFRYQLWDGGRWLLGSLERGTDCLANDVAPRLLRHLQAQRPQLVVGEGQRLANNGFFGVVAAMDYDVRVLWLDAPERTSAARAAGRGGRTQHPAWARGRATATESVASRWCTFRDRINADTTVATVARQVLDALSESVHAP